MPTSLLRAPSHRVVAASVTVVAVIAAAVSVTIWRYQARKLAERSVHSTDSVGVIITGVQDDAGQWRDGDWRRVGDRVRRS